MADYRINVKVRNARILGAIEKAGYRPGQPFATLIGISYKFLLDYVNCQRVPFDEDGNLRPDAEKLCIFFNVLPNDLWSTKQRIPLLKNEVEHDIDEVNIESLLFHRSKDFGVLENMVRDETFKSIRAALDTIPEKDANILRLRFGFDGEEKSLQEVGDIYGVSVERIRQIENKALRRLHHPSHKLEEIARELCPSGIFISDINRLFGMQVHLNNGKGLFCIRIIYEDLLQKKYQSAQLRLSCDWETIVQYPEICKLLKRLDLINDHRYQVFFRDKEGYQTSVEKLRITVYDKLVKMFYKELGLASIFEVFGLARSCRNAVFSEGGDSEESKDFNTRINKIGIIGAEIEILKNAINIIVQEANEEMVKISSLQENNAKDVPIGEQHESIYRQEI